MTPDIVMVIGDETNAESNWQHLLSLAPRARRIDAAISIRAAFVEAAKIATTSHFFLVDGDNWLREGFGFEVDFEPRSDEVVVWCALNPVNRLIYPHGGIKLLPTERILWTSTSDAIDVTTSIATGLRVVPVMASEHRFNTSPLEAWRTAFRECAKFASRSIRGLREEVISDVINAWCSKGADAPFGNWSMLGARDGRSFGEVWAKHPENIGRVNDYQWLRLVFEQHYGPRI